MSALQLLCLPHANGSAAFYQRWSESLPTWVQVRALGFSFSGGLPRVDIGMLAKQLANAYQGAEQPLALLGHGLGGLLAFELAHWLRQSGRSEPLALFVSGVVAPSRCDSSQWQGWRHCIDPWLHAPGDAGPDGPGSIPPGGLLLPTNYAYRLRAPLRSSIHVLDRRQGELRVESLLEWQQETLGDFSLDLLERHHFFIQQQEARTLRLVCRYCERHLRRWRSEGLRATG